MFWRALFAFIALPGVVAILVPALIVLYAPGAAGIQPVGFLPLILGTILLLWCTRDFYVLGKGTLALSAPPRRIVVTGLYRYTRNPMYVAVCLMLVGWAASFGSVYVLIYALAVLIFFHLRVVLFEEPWMARLHGKAYEQYCATVPRWLL